MSAPATIRQKCLEENLREAMDLSHALRILKVGLTKGYANQVE